MLEGLEISIVNLSSAKSIVGEYRWDSEYYKKKYLKTELLIRQLNTEPLSAKCNFIKKGIFDLPPSNYREEGIPLIRTSEIKKPTISFNTTVYIDHDTNQDNYKTILQPYDLVFTKIGAYIGDVAMLPSSFNEYNFSQNVAGISLKNKAEGPYLLAFFLSTLGRNQILRSIMLSGQGKLELEDIRNYEIPLLSKDLINNINNIFDTRETIIKDSQLTYIQAENLLLEPLGLIDYEPSKEPYNVKSFKESFGVSSRLDAEYYQVKYELIIDHIKNFSNGYTYVKDEFMHETGIINKQESNYCYTEIGDVDISDGSISFNNVDIDNLPANAKMILKKGYVIISKVRPYRGAIGIIREEPENYVGSGAFTVLSEKSNYTSETLKVLLRSAPYKELMMKYNVGSSYPVIKDDDILNLPIPIVPIPLQREITFLVGESFKLKKQSEHLSEVAKTAIEIGIEQNEKIAIAYINENRRI